MGVGILRILEVLATTHEREYLTLLQLKQPAIVGVIDVYYSTPLIVAAIVFHVGAYMECELQLCDIRFKVQYVTYYD
jgi:hypothetical protein